MRKGVLGENKLSEFHLDCYHNLLRVKHKCEIYITFYVFNFYGFTEKKDNIKFIFFLI